MRYDIVSDTHGYLSEELLEALKGADLIVHAGDMCSVSDFHTLQAIAPIRMCLGNNDWDPYAYGLLVKKKIKFRSEGFRWQVSHYERNIDPTSCDIGIFGHTHRSSIAVHQRTHTLMINPGSPTWPRDGKASIARVIVDGGRITDAQIVVLGEEKRYW
jgi:putative phosphoesterase